MAEILQSAEKIKELNARVDETYKSRNKNERKRKEWDQACANFNAQYNDLAFPGGYDGAYERILNGHPKAMEAAICFLECRPYFFRSGYMWRDLFRKAKRAPLNANQKQRLERVVAAYEAYRKSKKAQSDR
jgi:hypothetical protein